VSLFVGTTGDLPVAPTTTIETTGETAMTHGAWPLQRELLGRTERFKVIVAHRRFGKTMLGVTALIRAAAQTKKKAARYAYLAPFQRQAKAVVWDLLKDQAALGVKEPRFHEGELRCDLANGARISLYGADDPDALRGLYFDGVVLDEFQQMDPRVWSEIVRPALADRKGWAIVAGTPMGRNALWQLFAFAKTAPDWHAALYRASESGVLPKEELAAARAVMSAEEYAQEFECAFDAAIRGAYYGEAIAKAEADKRIGSVPHEPRLVVHTAWDLGIADPTAIWFYQRHRREIRLIDYYEASGAGLDHYARVLEGKGYVYGEHVLPHDAYVPELGSGKTRFETLIGLGIRPRVLSQHRVPDGINEVRRLLPRCWFDAAKCARGLEALRHYRCEWDERRKTFREGPLHDWSSHAADAFRYLAMGLREEVGLPPIKYDDRWIT
jgi:hypothetical protein